MFFLRLADRCPYIICVPHCSAIVALLKVTSIPYGKGKRNCVRGVVCGDVESIIALFVHNNQSFTSGARL